MQPQVAYELLWDPAVERNGGRARQVLEQLLAATREPLVPTRQRDLLTALTDDPSLIHRFRVTPAQLPGLVEHNPNVAVQVNFRMLIFMSWLHCTSTQYREASAQSSGIVRSGCHLSYGSANQQ